MSLPPYSAYGACLDAMTCQDNEVLVSGPAGTGKSLACLMKDGGDVASELWGEVAVEVATLAAEDAAAVVNTVDELKAARRHHVGSNG